MDSQPTDEALRPADDPAGSEADVEGHSGHSVFAALAASGALRPRSSRDGESQRNRADEASPPLTKPFPSMRADRRK
jgi:hypothetical protein